MSREYAEGLMWQSANYGAPCANCGKTSEGHSDDQWAACTEALV